MIIYNEKHLVIAKQSPQICWHKFLATTSHIHKSIMKNFWWWVKAWHFIQKKVDEKYQV
jgi:hypothetical protein